MLFNSYAFLFIFLPIALAGYQLAGHFSRRAVILWLGVVSLAFYAYWRPPYVLLLLGSLGFNYTVSALISRRIPNRIRTEIWLWIAIAINLGTLAYFKYLFPVLGLISSRHWAEVVLPLGISFFTFTQIAYLVDLQQGAASPEDFSSYLLFVSFFPHLIAGPILHHREMMPQFTSATGGRYQLHARDLAVGFTWFVMGLGKKVLLADTFAQTANTVYGTPGQVGFFIAWRAVLCYALQLYFDFSGYSDMALGLARMFSIDFPINFASPYKSTSIIEYWQRWHITLTQYITAYLYSPLQLWLTHRRQERGLALGRKALASPGVFAQLVVLPLLFTFVITGIWHGAGLKYIVFGLLHGLYLTLNHGFRRFRARGRRGNSVTRAAAVLLTFLSVIAAQTFFRGSSCRQAVALLASMIGVHGLGGWHLRDESTAAAFYDLASVSVGLIIVWTLPNTQQILQRFRPALALTQWDTPSKTRWSPTVSWALAVGGVFFLSLVYLQQPSSFLYFQF